jgi:hypothetical protein
MYPNATHLGFVVPDIDKAISETLTRFGLDKTKVVVRTSFKVSGGIYNGKKVDFSTQVSLIELGNMHIEFFQPTSGSSPYADQLKQHPEGSLHHVAFAVPSIADQLIKERALIPSLRIVLDAKIGSNGRYLYVDGVLPGLLVEYIQTST